MGILGRFLDALTNGEDAKFKPGDKVYIIPYGEEGVVKYVVDARQYVVEFESDDGNDDDEEVFFVDDLKKI